MYVRFANVQYARIAHDCIRFRPQWKAAYIAHADFLQVKYLPLSPCHFKLTLLT